MLTHDYQKNYQCANEMSAFPFVSDVPPLLRKKCKGGGGMPRQKLALGVLA